MKYYLATPVAVDVATTWTELQPLWGLHHRRGTSAAHLIRTRQPFPLREWHSDNGSEFPSRWFLQLTHKRKSARIQARADSSAGRARPLQSSPWNHAPR